jgi:uncharacterized membrane protein YedE/YeeE
MCRLSDSCRRQFRAIAPQKGLIMSIDWQHFTPWTSLGGGILIGIAAGVLILASNRILGVSGILGGLFKPRPGDAGWRLWFILGLFLAPLAWRSLAALQAPAIGTHSAVLAIAGVLVGFGTRLGSGCTSGHGVCGLSRLSPRSLVATALFMLAGFITVFVTRHVIG